MNIIVNLYKQLFSSSSNILILSIIFGLMLIIFSRCDLFDPDPIELEQIILSATISEQPPFSKTIEGRIVHLSIELTKLPVCDEENVNWQYGFLIDTDRDSTTGARHEAFSDLGIDAQIIVSCNSDSGKFTSNIGDVILSNGNSGSTITVETTVEKLPSVNFYFIAFIHDGTKLTRLPESSAAGWAINEILMY